jgi:AraC-like DNA-binding protein
LPAIVPRLSGRRARIIDASHLAFLLVDAALRGTVVALLVLLAIALRRDRPRSAAGRTSLLMALGLCVQVLGSAPLVEAEVSRLWQAPLVAVSVANGVLFWVFIQALFDDEFALRPIHVAAWLAVAALAGLNCAVLAGSGSPLAAATVDLQRAVPLVFAALAAVAAASHWRADLVEGRRRLRGFIVIAGIGYTLVALAGRLGSVHGQLSAAAATTDTAALLVIVAVVAVRLLRLGGSELFPSAPSSGAPLADPAQTQAVPETGEPIAALRPADPAEERLAEALQRAMLHERAYRSEDLSIATLAARLSVPEYRLRRLINRRLGHRNFNAYVNGFRLDEARAALSDPAQRDLPILTIALEAGFQSIGPFNRSFKTLTGLTPSDFRKQKLADS